MNKLVKQEHFLEWNFERTLFFKKWVKCYKFKKNKTSTEGNTKVKQGH